MRSLLRQVEELREQNGAISVDVVTVEIGPLSGVESELLKIAFDRLAPESFVPCPKLHIDMISLQLKCRDCGQISSVDKIEFQCPECRSRSVQVLRGDEFRLIDVSMQVPALATGDQQ